MTVVSSMPDPSVTFSKQSELWLASLKTRKRKPVSPATLRVFGSYVRRLAPMIGEMKLADINNGVLRELVQKLHAERLGAKTINELVAVVKQVVASLVDDNTGEPLMKRAWSARFIDCPTVSEQKQYCATREDVERCIKDAANDQERLLYSILAGTGLRISEALAIHVDGREDQTSWNRESQAIYVRSSVFNGQEIPGLKTAAAKRIVDLDPALSDLIARYVEINGIHPGDYLFQARSGRPMHLKTVRERLAKHEIPGFHSFRTFFISRRRSLGFPEFLLRAIVGHSGSSITDVYDKSAEDETYRKQWAKKAGLGFALPELGPPRSDTKSAVSHVPAEPVELAEEVVRYQASDEDLPIELFQPPTESLVEVK